MLKFKYYIVSLGLLLGLSAISSGYADKYHAYFTNDSTDRLQVAIWFDSNTPTDAFVDPGQTVDFYQDHYSVGWYLNILPWIHKPGAGPWIKLREIDINGITDRAMYYKNNTLYDEHYSQTFPGSSVSIKNIHHYKNNKNQINNERKA